MANASIQMLMEKLKQLINCNDIPFIYNHPEIISQRPQFQLLYHELQSIIQILGFIHQHQYNEKVNDLKKRFKDATEEAQYIVDLFLSGVHVRSNGNFLTSKELSPSLNLEDVRKSFESVKVEFMNMRIDSMKMDSSETPVCQSAPAKIPITGNPKGSKKLLDEIVVGLGREAELIRDKLVEDKIKVDVVSIVGMGGIGKTTLAKKVFNDDYVKYHFNVRVWVGVSQTYDKRAVLTQILESIGVKLDFEKARESKNVGEFGFYEKPTDFRLLEKFSDSRLRELVHKNLMGKRYLIVIDDIWHIETWGNLKLFFPHENNGSRILLTSRETEVAKHASSDGLIHHLGYLNKEKCWELLCQKVFHGNEVPEWSIKPGMQIIENCQGLPLAVVVIAGLLAKEAESEKFWMEIAERTGSYIVGGENGCLETLGLSYNHLPLHLRECFLYLGGFPEDHKFEVQRLIQLWVAEGFIQEDGNKSLEDIAESYLMDLTDRNLVIVVERMKSNGGVKACKMHDLVRELCLRKAREEQLILVIERLILSSNVIAPPYRPVRAFVTTNDLDIIHMSTQNLRSILSFSDFRSLSNEIAKYFRSFALLRVLDLQTFKLRYFPSGMELLIHLRYLAIRNSSFDFPSSICNLWNLQTLIYSSRESGVDLPSNISDLVNLRHLLCPDQHIVLGSIEKPMNLQIISPLLLWNDEACNFPRYFPCIKELSCINKSYKHNDFQSFTYLERLSLWSSPVHDATNHITFPATLKTLKLVGCKLPWSDMSIVQSLPNLQVLKLRNNAFEGSFWNTDGQEFHQLKFLRLELLDIKQWEAYSGSFPCLRQLEIIDCKDLEEIPLEIGDIPTLELIKIKYCKLSVCESVTRIQQEQQDMGNYDLKIRVIPFQRFYVKDFKILF